MMTDLHPYRYPNAFQGQLNRLEGLYPGITTGTATPSFLSLRIEKTGLTPAELARRNLALRHLERLIFDWRVDGETVFNAKCSKDERHPGSAVEFPDIPAVVSYIAFEDDPALRLHRPRSRIEGFYLREIAYRGKFSVELTFVCQEPGWTTVDTCVYADAMEIGSRISVGIVPLGEKFLPGEIIRYFESEATLATERALVEAISLASEFANSYAWKQSAVFPPVFNGGRGSVRNFVYGRAVEH
jgi:hypothetical protein